jgi:hypothetical protein
MKIKNTKKVVVFIASEQKGFLIAIADQLSKNGFDVLIAAQDHNVKKLVNRLIPGFSRVEVLADINVDISDSDIATEAMRIERQYDTTMAILLSEDRAFGQGYLTNVEKVPDVIRAWWPFNRKISNLVKNIKREEMLLGDADFIIQIWPNKARTMVINALNGKSFSFTSIKHGARMFWSDNDYITSSCYIERMLSSVVSNSEHIRDYEVDRAGDIVSSRVNFTYKKALIKGLSILFQDTQQHIRGINKKNSYRYLGWLPSVFRSISNYLYVKHYAVSVDSMKHLNIVYFTLHLEPEVALQYFSPEFTNSMEAIIWISKSLPVNYRIVVKEHLLSYGVRSKWYYDQLIKLPNVEISDPDINSWDWIKESKIVATITGTVGQEAVHFKKPVLSFGKHQIINHLPTVQYVNNYETTKTAIDKIINEPYSEDIFTESKNIFSYAQIESSIKMPEYEYAIKSSVLEKDMAKKALIHLFEEYPDLKK